jgi:hypothetical protein
MIDEFFTGECLHIFKRILKLKCFKLKYVKEGIFLIKFVQTKTQNK